jgi:hypothetical protein
LLRIKYSAYKKCCKGSSDKTPLTATIYCDGTRVTIITSKSGIAHYLAGSINSNGDMLVYDRYDGEAWTTHFGPATSTKIYLYDYAWPPVAGEPEPPLNKLKLTRPPVTPDGVTATDGTIFDAIVVSWNLQTGAQPLRGLFLYGQYTNNLHTHCRHDR